MLLHKLHSYFEKSLFVKEKPNFQYYSNYHWFTDKNKEWIGIPVDAIDPQELTLLKTLFDYEVSPYHTNSNQKNWYDFLFLNSDVLPEKNKSPYRIIQFQIKGTDWETQEIEEAIHGFIGENTVILWESKDQGVFIELNLEENKLDEELLSSLSQTLESDFFIQTYFYYGKIKALTHECPKEFQEDQFIFRHALKLMPTERVFSFEKCLPSLLSAQLPNMIKEFINSQILNSLSAEPDLIKTIKPYLENNSNATLTAKQLYIHRNTLQYRLDKFSENTGINLKDFNSAITVYLACLIYIQSGRS